MVQQGRVLAAALSERGALTQPVVEPILVRLEQRTTSRLRVLDREGWLLSDTSRLGPLRESPPEIDDLSGSGPRSSWLYRFGSTLVRLSEQIVAEPRPPVSAEEFYSADAPFEGAEIGQALSGEYGAATRITPGGQRSVTLYSALPVLNEGDVVGVVLVSQSTFHILQDLYEVRLAVFRFLLGAVVLAAVLSLLALRDHLPAAFAASLAGRGASRRSRPAHRSLPRLGAARRDRRPQPRPLRALLSAPGAHAIHRVLRRRRLPRVQEPPHLDPRRHRDAQRRRRPRRARAFRSRRRARHRSARKAPLRGARGHPARRDRRRRAGKGARLAHASFSRASRNPVATGGAPSPSSSTSPRTVSRWRRAATALLRSSRT